MTLSLIDRVGPSRQDTLTLAEVAEFEALRRRPKRFLNPRYMALLRRRAPGWTLHEQREDIVA